MEKKVRIRSFLVLKKVNKRCRYVYPPCCSCLRDHECHVNLIVSPRFGVDEHPHVQGPTILDVLESVINHYSRLSLDAFLKVSTGPSDDRDQPQCHYPFGASKSGGSTWP